MLIEKIEAPFLFDTEECFGMFFAIKISIDILKLKNTTEEVLIFASKANDYGMGREGGKRNGKVNAIRISRNRNGLRKVINGCYKIVEG